MVFIRKNVKRKIISIIIKLYIVEDLFLSKVVSNSSVIFSTVWVSRLGFRVWRCFGSLGLGVSFRWSFLVGIVWVLGGDCRCAFNPFNLFIPFLKNSNKFLLMTKKKKKLSYGLQMKAIDIYLIVI